MSTRRAPLPPGIALREESAADLSWLAELYAETRAAELAPVPWPAEAKRAFLADQFQRQHDYYRQTYVGADYLVIERDGAPIGRLYVQRGRGEIRVMDIALIESERGRGVGTALIEHLMQEAAEAESELTLHVEPNNPAQRLYARLGFRLIEDRGVYHFLGWRSQLNTAS
ncbi:MAG TPA: GNAT family N-acetyltransferase [Rhodanobacteraceae bacterium]|nr:GNAT family N-acetyltransferase [Rhodanobacteraceae bacterium]